MWFVLTPNIFVYFLSVVGRNIHLYLCLFILPRPLVILCVHLLLDFGLAAASPIFDASGMVPGLHDSAFTHAGRVGGLWPLLESCASRWDVPLSYWMTLTWVLTGEMFHFLTGWYSPACWQVRCSTFLWDDTHLGADRWDVTLSYWMILTRVLTGAWTMAQRDRMPLPVCLKRCLKGGFFARLVIQPCKTRIDKKVLTGEIWHVARVNWWRLRQKCLVLGQMGRTWSECNWLTQDRFERLNLVCAYAPHGADWEELYSWY